VGYCRSRAFSNDNKCLL